MTTKKHYPLVSMNRWLKANPRNSKHGAPLGKHDDPLDETQPVHVEKLEWVDGDYILDGTYFGRSAQAGDVYAIGQGDNHSRRAAYIRARSRNMALAEVASRRLTALRPY
mgnify:CR=1 FL=1